jgi:large subunit ribosomal protein L25
MQETFELEAETRTDLGKGASRRLRRTNGVPAIVYGGGKDPKQITLKHNILMQHLDNEAFYSHILSLKVDGKAEKVVLRDLQRHPAKPIIMHADFLRVNEDEVIKMNVPLHFLNEDVAPGVKTQGGAVSHLFTEVEIACKGKDLPEYIEVDVADLNIGDSIHLSEIKLPEGVEIVALMQGADQDQAVVSVHKTRAVSAEAEEEGEGEAEGEAEGEGEEA